MKFVVRILTFLLIFFPATSFFDQPHAQCHISIRGDNRRPSFLKKIGLNQTLKDRQVSTPNLVTFT